MVMAIAAGAAAQSAPSTDAHGRLTGSRGMTLYSYDPDGSSGQSHCDGSCAALWPPYVAESGAQPHAGFGLVVRADHSRQWSYQGHPLYRYAGDTTPGTALGDGLNGQWHVVHAH